jgi:hypothetical protein
LTAPGSDTGGKCITLRVADLRLAPQFLQFGIAIVMRVRRHRPPPMRASRFQLCQGSGNGAGERFPLFVLGNCGAYETTHGAEYHNREEYLVHGPPFIAECLA